MPGFLKNPAQWRKFYAALIPVAALIVTYIWGDSVGAKAREFLLLVEAALIPVLVGAVPNAGA